MPLTKYLLLCCIPRSRDFTVIKFNLAALNPCENSNFQAGEGIDNYGACINFNDIIAYPNIY